MSEARSTPFLSELVARLTLAEQCAARLGYLWESETFHHFALRYRVWSTDSKYQSTLEESLRSFHGSYLEQVLDVLLSGRTECEIKQAMQGLIDSEAVQPPRCVISLKK